MEDLKAQKRLNEFKGKLDAIDQRQAEQKDFYTPNRVGGVNFSNFKATPFSGQKTQAATDFQNNSRLVGDNSVGKPESY